MSIHILMEIRVLMLLLVYDYAYVYMYGVDIRFWFSVLDLLYHKLSLYVLTSSGGGGVVDDGTHQSSMVLRVLVYSIGWVCTNV